MNHDPFTTKKSHHHLIAIWMLLLVTPVLAFQKQPGAIGYDIRHSLSARDAGVIEYGIAIDNGLENRYQYRSGPILGFRPTIIFMSKNNDWTIEDNSKYSVPLLIYLNTMSYERLQNIDDLLERKKSDSIDVMDKIDRIVCVILSIIGGAPILRNIEAGYRLENGVSFRMANIMHDYNDKQIFGIGFSLGVSKTKISIDYLYRNLRRNDNKLSFTVETGLHFVK